MATQVLLLRLCVATAILPEKAKPNFWQIELTNKRVIFQQYNSIEFIQLTFYTNEHPSFPPFSVLLQVRCLVAVTIYHLHDFWLLLLLLLLLLLRTRCAVPSMLGGASLLRTTSRMPRGRESP